MWFGMLLLGLLTAVCIFAGMFFADLGLLEPYQVNLFGVFAIVMMWAGKFCLLVAEDNRIRSVRAFIDKCGIAIFFTGICIAAMFDGDGIIGEVHKIAGMIGAYTVVIAMVSGVVMSENEVNKKGQLGES